MSDGTRSLAGRKALVTGSTGGLGLAIADSLAREGCSIVLNGLISPEEGGALGRDIARRHGVEAVFHGADLARPEAIEALVWTAKAEFGELDIVVNNAVVRQFAPVELMPIAGWDQSIAVNLSAAFHTIRLTLPGMRKRGFGRIVNVSSIYGLIGATNRADYVTTKTALIGLTRAVALETAESGITCNAICPGTVPTEAITERICGIAASAGITEAAATKEYLATRQPTRRFVATEGVAALIAFLCGEGGRDITGAALPVDGAWSIA
ncbi:SDR family NAD(P)-dependent oxidoreductase [Enterovirga aerilata]|uniref:SDR family oxidoreductase n=1 Tax=Enterovirga aerilata TaxID=2730920 RepID=A0A849I9I5_9HYPH|nr:SDR family NAD(P)-dependent oxidoreductase [Enterovirga sp. DB1703]NNM72935.1 SDR family oxidoreductase [Enterovirga sp. DB1703]